MEGFGKIILACALAASFSAVFLLIRSLQGYILLRKKRAASQRSNRLSSQFPLMKIKDVPHMMAVKAVEARIPVISVFARRAFNEEDKREKTIKEQLPAALRAMGSSLSAGQSAQQAFAYVAANSKEPLSREFLEVVWDINAGRSLTEALERLSARVALPEIALIGVAFSLQQRTGGSIQAILDSASDSIRESFEFEQSIEVQTAQAKMSARVVGLVPFVLLGALTLASPSYMQAFLASPLGLGIFLLALFLDGLGFIAIKKIIKVEV